MRDRQSMTAGSIKNSTGDRVQVENIRRADRDQSGRPEFRVRAYPSRRCCSTNLSHPGMGVERNRVAGECRHKKAGQGRCGGFLVFLFGDPGFFSNPEPVPTLRYVWTNKEILNEDAIDNPYFPGVVRSIIVRRGKAAKNEWMFERRNLLNDFKAAFGYLPKDRIHAFALFTDNDQTQQPVTAYYGWARVICGS
jgi:hypothetical protein